MFVIISSFIDLVKEVNMNAAILIADGFEDAEMVIVNDLLRRLDISVEIVSSTGSLNLKYYYLM